MAEQGQPEQMIELTIWEVYELAEYLRTLYDVTTQSNTDKI